MLQEQRFPGVDLLIRIVIHLANIEHLASHLHELQVRSSPLLETEVAYGVVADQVF